MSLVEFERDGEYFHLTVNYSEELEVDYASQLKRVLRQHATVTSMTITDYAGLFDYRLLRYLPQLRSLELLVNLDLTEQPQPLLVCPRLESLAVLNSAFHGQLSELWAGLTELRELTVSMCDYQTTENWRLPLSLTHLTVVYQDLTSLEELGPAPLQELRLLNLPELQHLEGLAQYPELSTLVLEDLELITDLGPLSYCPYLTKLTLNYLPILTLPPLPHLAVLETDRVHLSNGQRVRTINEYQASWRSAKNARSGSYR